MIKLLSFSFALSALTMTSVKASVPSLAVTFDTNVVTFAMSNLQEDKIVLAEEKIRDVIASEEFRTKILNHTYNGKKTFVDNGGLTNTEIYYKILYGAEKLQPAKDNEMDLGIKVYYENSNVVGYTTTGSKNINMNTKYLNNYTSNQVTRNMMHEWLHKLGFKHAVNYSTSRDYSVPYAVGSIMEKIAIKF